MSKIPQSKGEKLEHHSNEVSDGCRKMFFGFNILDNQKSENVFNDIEFSSYQRTETPSSSQTYDENMSSTGILLSKSDFQNFQNVHEGITYGYIFKNFLLNFNKEKLLRIY